MGWDNQLESASFGGIEFDVASVSDDIERRVVEHEYAYRDGADLEDTGRAARPTSFQAIFHGEGYLTRLTEFQRLVDTGETRTLRHPLLGTWQAKALRMSVQHEHARRDAATVELQFKEDGTSTLVPLVESISDASQNLDDGLADLDTAHDEFDDGPVAAVTDFETDATAYMSDLEESTDTRETRFDTLQAYGKAAVDALDDLGDDVASVPLIRSIRKIQHAARAAREAYDAAQPSVVEHDIAADASLTAVASALYGDPDRVADLLRLNQVRNPFLMPSGTRIKVHGE